MKHIVDRESVYIKYSMFVIASGKNRVVCLLNDLVREWNVGPSDSTGKTTVWEDEGHSVYIAVNSYRL